MFSAKTKTLVVDDMMTMRKIVKKCLKDICQIDATEADDGQTAWVHIEEALNSGTPFDLIISDWNMPGMKGIDLLRKVRSHPVMKTVPFILVTAESEKSQVVEGIQEGVSAYIVKPFSPDTLSQRLNEVYAKTKK